MGWGDVHACPPISIWQKENENWGTCGLRWLGGRWQWVQSRWWSGRIWTSRCSEVDDGANPIPKMHAQGEGRRYGLECNVSWCHGQPSTHWLKCNKLWGHTPIKKDVQCRSRNQKIHEPNHSSRSNYIQMGSLGYLKSGLKLESRQRHIPAFKNCSEIMNALHIKMDVLLYSLSCFLKNFRKWSFRHHWGNEQIHWLQVEH